MPLTYLDILRQLMAPPVADPGVSYGDSHWGDGVNALDIFAPQGAPVQAVQPGMAYYNYYPAGGHTYHLLGDDGNTYYYAHLLDPGMFPNGPTRVEAGQQLGQVGQSGGALVNGQVVDRPIPHLHFGAGHGQSLDVIDQNGAGDIPVAPWVAAAYAAPPLMRQAFPPPVPLLGSGTDAWQWLQQRLGQ